MVVVKLGAKLGLGGCVDFGELSDRGAFLFFSWSVRRRDAIFNTSSWVNNQSLHDAPISLYF